jgi:predicted Zn-dependent peptidase
MKLKLFLIAISLLMLGHLSAAAQEQAKVAPPAGGPAKPFVLPKAESFALKNGLRVTIVPYGSVPKLTISAIVRTGNIDESANQVSLADITGDMLKQGTATRTGAQIAEEAARMGGRISVNTGSDTTTISGDALSAYGPQMVALLADVLEHPSFPATELQRLKTNMLRQLAVARSQPGPLANELFRKLLYPDHPYGRLFPTEQMVNGYSITDVKDFYGKNFGAERTHIYVAGKFDSAAMRDAITKTFEGWERGTAAAKNVPSPVSAKEIHLLDRPNTPQATVYVGLPVIDPSNPDYVAFQVTNALLGGSFASRITSNIREQKGYTYSPSSAVSTHYRDAYWVEIADVTTAVTGPSIKEIFFEIDRLRNEPPSEAELQGIKNYLAGIFVLQNSSRQGVIGQLSFADLHGLPPNYLSTYVQKVMAVTPKDVQRIAQQYIQPDKMTVVVVGDKAKVEPQLSPFGKVISN